VHITRGQISVQHKATQIKTVRLTLVHGYWLTLTVAAVHAILDNIAEVNVVSANLNDESINMTTATMACMAFS